MTSEERKFSDWDIHGFGNAPAMLYPEIDSTHSLMKSLASAGKIVPGTLIVADTQTAGRGRHDRTWVSPAGKNIYFNILIPLDGIPLNRSAQVTQVAALTFAEVFRQLQSDSQSQVTVKWPNDILFGKSKFCGILAEVVHLNGSPAISMGVGINVNGDSADYAHLGRAVTTLKEIADRTINREKLLQALVGSLERAIGQFRSFGIGPWVNAWRKMDHFIGARGTIIVSEHCTDTNRDGGAGVVKKEGTILDMNEDGSLVFKCDDGQVETVYSADLEI